MDKQIDQLRVQTVLDLDAAAVAMEPCNGSLYHSQCMLRPTPWQRRIGIVLQAPEAHTLGEDLPRDHSMPH